MINCCGSRVLVICPHTDDEFGCAGTIYRLIHEDAEIRYVALSRCEASVPDPFPKDILEVECRKCTSILGIKDESAQIMDYPVRHFPEHRQDILEMFVRLNREYSPELVLLPSSYDTHQDHATVFHEGFRAFKNTTLLGYELPQNLISFDNSAFIRLSEECIMKKIEALSQYASQTFRRYSSPEFVKGLAIVRGAQCNTDYAEAYEVIRFIL
jgi:LmbE family N-acetylglucosaminyl deacetylase